MGKVIPFPKRYEVWREDVSAVPTIWIGGRAFRLRERSIVASVWRWFGV